MNINVNWLIDAADAARRAFNSPTSVLVELSIHDKGVRVDGRASGYHQAHMVPWSDLTGCKFNPLLPVIEVTVAALRRALAAAPAGQG